MNWTLVSLFFDFVLLLLLVATIAYSARLSLSLRRFKENRNVLDKMINELNQNVNNAHDVIQQLQNTAKQTGRELQMTVDQASNLSDELSLMNEAGNNLADRLEKLAERNSVGERDVFDDRDLSRLDNRDERSASKKSKVSKSKPAVKKSAQISDEKALEDAESFLDRVFAIRDPDIERGDNPLDNLDPLDEDDDVHSEAERDLLKALQSQKK